MKYSNYIGLSANYESVVDLEAEERNPNLWQEYIVHGDMQKAIDAICKTMEWQDNDKRRSFWIHGAYGTGKSYAAIVLKHLFEDKPTDIEGFLNRPSLLKYKARFLGIRRKGEFLVVWKSGATDIKSGTHLMMEMEVKIKERLKDKFGVAAYYGNSSLINAAKDAIENNAINWEGIFDNPLYDLSDVYVSLDEFRMAVLDGEPTAINKVKRICDELHFSIFTDTVEKFMDWLKDIIAGNRLEDSGIVFIWDEFTGFLRDCGDDNVLQQLSELCKQPNAPFFMCLIVHRDPAWVDQLGGETYERILHRYHELEFHITESAAYDLIGDSIIPKAGMETQWEEVKGELLKSITKWKHEYDNLDQSININERMAKLCPLHPMTLSMLATVAQNFGASQRTLFRFMKDQAESSQGVGFIYYIENNNPNEWKWLTVDYLWDYFFTRNSDVRDYNTEARKVIQHFQNKVDSVSDEYAMHVFKAALLLIAVMSGRSISNLYSRQTYPSGKISATKYTLYKCFRGQLEQIIIDSYLASFEDIGLLRLDEHPSGDARLELPYMGSADLFELKLEITKGKYTRYYLFTGKGIFSKALEGYMWDSTRTTYGRMYIAACAADTNSLNARLGEVKKELEKYPYKIGLLVISIANEGDYSVYQKKVKQIVAEHDSDRLVVVILREPCTDSILDSWHRAFTHMELSRDEGKSASAHTFEAETGEIVSRWAATASDSQIYACYRDIEFTGIYGKSDLIKRIEEDVLYEVFPAAIERLVTVNTAFKRCNDGAVLAGLTGEVGNRQVNNIVNPLRSIGAWDVDNLDDLRGIVGEDAVAITRLASLFQGELLQGGKIPLDLLWIKLQSKPFGYYNSMAAGCFIGLVMRSHIGGTFNWIDASNNTHLPTAVNLASMVNKMLSGNTLNHYLSSGTEIWQRFKPYIQAIFELTEQEVVSEDEARKYAKQRIIGLGVPFWSLKYLRDDRYGGVETKSIVFEIVDHFCDFLYGTSADQENTMASVYSLFTGRGKIRELIKHFLADKAVMLQAFKTFIFTKIGELEGLYVTLDLTDKDLLDMLSTYLQNAVTFWDEEQVTTQLSKLATELNVISIIRSEIGTNVKTYGEIQIALNNIFDHMKVPGTIVETLSFDWIPAMKLMRQLSKTSWLDVPNKKNVGLVLEKNARKAWENLTQPKLLLEAIIDSRDINYTEEELDWIYLQLKPQIYETPWASFNSNLNRLLENITYKRDVTLLKDIWQNKSGTPTVKEWCNSMNIPITWLFEDSDIIAIRTIRAIQDNRRVEGEDLKRALAFIQRINLPSEIDRQRLDDIFFAHIGGGYLTLFQANRNTLIDQLKTDGKLTSDVYTWEGKIPQIRMVLDGYLQKKYQEKAKTRVRSMPETELRDIVLRLLDRNPELYSTFLE